MKNITKTIIAIAAGIATFAAASCSKDNTIRYNNATMGNIVNGRFTSDQGNIFNVTDQTCAGKLDTMKRAFVICDVLNQVEGSENEYDVRLNFLASVLTKEAVPASSITEGNELANDPIILQDYWISGGYINIYLSIPIVSGSKAKHYINFIYDDIDKTEGTYTFHIRHDASEEVFNEENESQIVFGYAYVSVPVASIIKEDNARVIINWLSHKVNGNFVMLSETIEMKRETFFSLDAYQQVPSEAQMTRSYVELH